MSFRVLVVGGSGAFGRRLVEQLAATTDCEIVVAGRNGAKLDAAIAVLKSAFPNRTIEGSILDKDTVRPERLRALNVNCVVDAAGPYQEAEPALARASIAAGSHYIDLADARDFVARFPELDAEARAAGVLAITGASSTPALSNAVLDRLTAGWQRVDGVAIAISPGNRAQPGLSVVEGILSYAGRPVRVWHGGRWTMRSGWGDLIREDMPDVGARWLSLCETPDLDIVPARFPSARTAMFRAGVELGFFHLGLWLLSFAVRWRLARSLKPFARIFHDIFEAFAAFGSDRGGMTVKAEGLDARGRFVRARWSLRADGDGPNIPILPALALIRRWSKVGAGDPGAKVCTGLLDLAALEDEFARFRIRTRTEAWLGSDAPVLAQAIGGSFETMPSLLRHIHSPAPKIELQGRVDIDGAENWAGRLVARLVGFGGSVRGLPASVSIERIGSDEVWTRRFGAHTFASRLSSERFGGLCERFGPITLALDAKLAPRGFSFAVRRWRLGPIPLPRFMMPSTRAQAAINDQGRYAFDVWVGMPLVGRLIRYRGWLGEAMPQAAGDLPAMKNNSPPQPLANVSAHS